MTLFFQYVETISTIRLSHPYLLCKFCNDPLVKPCICTICDGLMCRICLSTGVSNICCNKKITDSNLIDIHHNINDLLDNIQVYCHINKSNGCQWVGKRCDYENHYYDCIQLNKQIAEIEKYKQIADIKINKQIADIEITKPIQNKESCNFQDHEIFISFIEEELERQIKLNPQASSSELHAEVVVAWEKLNLEPLVDKQTLCQLYVRDQQIPLRRKYPRRTNSEYIKIASNKWKKLIDKIKDRFPDSDLKY